MEITHNVVAVAIYNGLYIWIQNEKSGQQHQTLR
mgnify:CR=1 FL=1